MNLVDQLKEWPATGNGDGLDAAVVRRLMQEAAIEIERLQEQCRGLANSAVNNGQGLLLYESALKKIAELSDSEDGEPLDDAIRIAEQALKFEAPPLPGFG